MCTKLYDDLGPEEVKAETRAAEKSVARSVDRHGETCPECGSEAYYPDGGCRACGYSPCK